MTKFHKEFKKIVDPLLRLKILAYALFYASPFIFENCHPNHCALEADDHNHVCREDLEMCRASVLHARCSMRMLPQDGSIVQAGRGKSSFQAA